LINDGIIDFNVLLACNYLEQIGNPSLSVINKLNILKNTTDYNIYKNKITLFTKLNNKDDCIICFENKINIDLHCGHCFCLDCYPYLYNKKCPLCRSKILII
jgi:hypothetical protein